MTLYLCHDRSSVPVDWKNNFCYLFMTKPQINDNYAFVKVGITEKQTIYTRLGQYASDGINLSNIVCITTTNVKNREKLILTLFNYHNQIKLHKGREYFEGNYKAMLNIFCYVTLLDDCSIAKSIDLDQINDLYQLIDSNKYNIVYIANDSVNNNNGAVKIMTLYNCSKCSKVCKDKRGLSIHEHKCGISLTDQTFSCEHCLFVFSTHDNLKKHMSRCKVLKEQEADEEKQAYVNTIRQEYETKIKKMETEFSLLQQKHKNDIDAIKQTYDLQLMIRDHDISSYVREVKSKEEEIKTLKDVIQHYNSHIDNTTNTIRHS
jgi:hypothetical protein